MDYTDSVDQQNLLREVIRHDLDIASPGERRSVAAIIRAVNAYLRDQGREKECINNIENVQHYIRDFVRENKSWRFGKEKRLLWEFYQYEGRIPGVSRFAGFPTFIENLLLDFFKGAVKATKSAEPLVGKFVIYKRSLTDPDDLLVRGFIEFKSIEGAPNCVIIEEIHVHRSYDYGTEAKQKEFWNGIAISRERGYAMITRESKKGTPKFAVVEIERDDGEKCLSLVGYSIECVENWSSVNVFKSNIYLQRVANEFDFEREQDVNFVSMSSVQRSDKNIVDHIIDRLGRK